MGQPLNPETCTVFALYRMFATEDEVQALAADYRAGTTGYGNAKKLLNTKIGEYFANARDKRRDLLNHPDHVEDILREGARKARREAQTTMELVREAVGMKPRPVA
jgi:tryptophanyl-tRNA synthetase